MISRQWTGIAKPSEAELYARHLREDTFPRLARIRGFIRAAILRRTVPKGEEFLIVTIWESFDAIRQFAGNDPERAVVPAVVHDMMVEYDRVVKHYTVAESYCLHEDKEGGTRL